MASRYGELDAATELEQLAAVLKAALEPRGCPVVDHGTCRASAGVEDNLCMQGARCAAVGGGWPLGSAIRR